MESLLKLFEHTILFLKLVLSVGLRNSRSGYFLEDFAFIRANSVLSAHLTNEKMLE